MVAVVVRRIAKHFPLVNFGAVVGAQQVGNEPHMRSPHVQVDIIRQRHIDIELVVLIRKCGVGNAKGYFEIALFAILAVTYF
jgi:hypothetical protein